MITNDIVRYKTAKMRVNACYLAFIIKAVKRLFYYVCGSTLVTFVTNKIKEAAISTAPVISSFNKAYPCQQIHQHRKPFMPSLANLPMFLVL
jgi:hypothetical protein